MISVFALLLTLSFSAYCEDLVKVEGVEMIDGDCLDEASMDCKLQKNASGQLSGKQTCNGKYEGKAKLYEATYENGKLHGRMKCWDAKGEPRIEADFVKGLREGKTKTAWVSKLNQWTAEEDYVAGERHGYTRTLSTANSEGKVTITGEAVRRWKKGKETGLMLSLEKNEVTAVGSCYVDGEPARPDEDCREINMGPYQSRLENYYQKQKSNEKSQCNGARKDPIKIDGVARYVLTSTVKNCKRDGAATLWTKDLRTKLVETNYEADQRQGKQKVYFDDGKIAAELNYHDNDPTNIAQYYQNGKKKLEAKFKSVEKVKTRAEIKRYDDRGNLQESYTALNQRERSHSGTYPEVQDQIPDAGFVGCRQIFENEKTVSETCYDEKGVRAGKSIFIKEGKRHEQVWEKGLKTAEKIIDLQTNKVIDESEFHQDGSRK